MEATYTGLVLLLLIFGGIALLRYGGPAAKFIGLVLVTPLVVFAIGLAVGLVIGSGVGCATPWVRRFQARQHAAALTETPGVADPFEGALQLAATLPRTRYVAFLHRLQAAWGISREIAQAVETLASTPAKGPVR